MANNIIVQQLRSKVKVGSDNAKLPKPSDFKEGTQDRYGIFAINYAAENETISTLNSNNEVVAFNYNLNITENSTTELETEVIENLKSSKSITINNKWVVTHRVIDTNEGSITLYGGYITNNKVHYITVVIPSNQKATFIYGEETFNADNIILSSDKTNAITVKSALEEIYTEITSINEASYTISNGNGISINDNESVKTIATNFDIKIEKQKGDNGAENDFIVIFDKTNNVEITKVDASLFVVDGMLNSATIITVNSETVLPEGVELSKGKYIKLSWNTNAGKNDTYIPVADLISEHKVVNGQDVNGEFVIVTTNVSESTDDNGIKVSTVNVTVNDTALKSTLDTKLGKEDNVLNVTQKNNENIILDSVNRTTPYVSGNEWAMISESIGSYTSEYGNLILMNSKDETIYTLNGTDRYIKTYSLMHRNGTLLIESGENPSQIAIDPNESYKLYLTNNNSVNVTQQFTLQNSLNTTEALTYLNTTKADKDSIINDVKSGSWYVNVTKDDNNIVTVDVDNMVQIAATQDWNSFAKKTDKVSTFENDSKYISENDTMLSHPATTYESINNSNKVSSILTENEWTVEIHRSNKATADNRVRLESTTGVLIKELIDPINDKFVYTNNQIHWFTFYNGDFLEQDLYNVNYSGYKFVYVANGTSAMYDLIITKNSDLNTKSSFDYLNSEVNDVKNVLPSYLKTGDDVSSLYNDSKYITEYDGMLLSTETIFNETINASNPTTSYFDGVNGCEVIVSNVTRIVAPSTNDKLELIASTGQSVYSFSLDETIRLLFDGDYVKYYKLNGNGEWLYLGQFTSYYYGYYVKYTNNGGNKQFNIEVKQPTSLNTKDSFELLNNIKVNEITAGSNYINISGDKTNPIIDVNDKVKTAASQIWGSFVQKVIDGISADSNVENVITQTTSGDELDLYDVTKIVFNNDSVLENRITTNTSLIQNATSIAGEAKLIADSASEKINTFLQSAEIGDEVIDTLKEIQTYINTDTTAADKMIKDIAAAQATADANTETIIENEEIITNTILKLSESIGLTSNGTFEINGKTTTIQNEVESLKNKVNDEVLGEIDSLKESIIENEEVLATTIITLNDSIGLNSNGEFEFNGETTTVKDVIENINDAINTNTSNLNNEINTIKEDIIDNEEVIANIIVKIKKSVGLNDKGEFIIDDVSNFESQSSVAKTIQNVDNALEKIKNGVGLDYNLTYTPKGQYYTANEDNINNAIAQLDKELAVITKVEKTNIVTDFESNSKLTLIDISSASLQMQSVTPPEYNEYHYILRNTNESVNNQVTVAIPQFYKQYNVINMSGSTITFNKYAEINVVFLPDNNCIIRAIID